MANLINKVQYVSLESHLRSAETVFNLKFGDISMDVHLVWTYSKKIKQKKYNPCLNVRLLYEYYISGRVLQNESERRILAIYGRGLCHMNKSSLILTSYIRSRWKRIMINT